MVGIVANPSSCALLLVVIPAVVAAASVTFVLKAKNLDYPK